MRIWRAAAATTLLAAALAGTQAHAQDTGEPIPLTYAHVPLETSSGGSRTPSGRLAYRGGLEIRSADTRFGGLSGLLVSADGSRLLAVSDTGYWLSAQLSYEADTLTGISGARIAPLLDPAGLPVTGSKSEGDAEGLAQLADGRLAVSFERHHRVWTYDYAAAGMSAPASPLTISPDLASARNNKGVEAIEALPDGSLLALTEGTYDDAGHIRGWRVNGASSTPVALTQVPPFDLTDLALLPSGDLLTLERRYSIIGGVGAQMRIIRADRLEAGGPLDGEIIYRSTASHTVDNMEGLAVRTANNGATLVYAVSDDNFNALQRTLLLMFELLPPANAG